MTPEHVLLALKHIILSNRMIQKGDPPSNEIANLLGLKVQRISKGFWTITNKNRKELLRISPTAQLTQTNKAEYWNNKTISANTRRIIKHRRDRIRSLGKLMPSHKFFEGWYPWLPSATRSPEAPSGRELPPAEEAPAPKILGFDIREGAERRTR